MLLKNRGVTKYGEAVLSGGKNMKRNNNKGCLSTISYTMDYIYRYWSIILIIRVNIFFIHSKKPND